MIKILGFSLFCLFGCIRPIQVALPIVEGVGWVARQDSATRFTVVTTNLAGEHAAMEKICSASYVCAVGPAGKVFVVERTRK